MSSCSAPIRFLGAALKKAASMLFLGCACSGLAAVTNFSVGFESAEGFVSRSALAGQGGWVGLMYHTNTALFTNSGAAGNGVVGPGLNGSGQAAYVGLTPLPTNYSKFVELSHLLPLDPIGSGLPVVSFSARIKIIDSTSPSGPWDFFSLDFYNGSDVRLFSILFDNGPQEIRHTLKSGSTNIETFLAPFSAGVEYDLAVMMNFASNRCTVSINGALPPTNTFALASSGSALNLGTLSAVWQVDTPGSPGDNYMLFDNLRVISSPLVPPNPTLTLLKAGGTNAAAAARVSGSDGYKFALESTTNLTSWQPISTNLISSGIANYTDAGATNKPARYYRARWVR
ncbi:MAG: hypothetical protein RLY20_175 [Verrucomicrobiota bacterium]|jgi:hypothetical protein